MPHPVGLLVGAVINMARRHCNSMDCGISRFTKVPGSKHRPNRCSDCPLADIDELVDGLLEWNETTKN